MKATHTADRSTLRLLACLLWLGQLVMAWRQGLFGSILVRVVPPRILPRMIGESVKLTSLGREADVSLPDRGLELALSPQRLDTVLEATRPWSWLVPPGLLSDKSVVRGVLLNYAGSNTVEDLPFAVVVTHAAGPTPRLTLRYPASELTHLVDELYEEKLESREEYFLGHYELEYEVRLNSFTLQSVPPDQSRPISRRRLMFDGKGTVRVKLKENLFRIQTTGTIKEFNGTVDIDVAYEPDGIGLRYNVDIRKFQVGFHRVSPYLDDYGSDVLRRSLEHSLNRKKKKDRFAERRFPPWTPVDLAVDIRVTPP